MPDPLQKARGYAFFLLKFRPRSSLELRLRLKKKGFAGDTIEETLAFLKAKKFIDDFAFAREWIECRLKKPYGLKRITQELILKGIEPKIIERIFGEVKKDYCEEEVVAQLVKKKRAHGRDEEPEKTKQRLYSYLLRRGFSADVALAALNK